MLFEKSVIMYKKNVFYTLIKTNVNLIIFIYLYIFINF